jgi:hypothetical protein
MNILTAIRSRLSTTFGKAILAVIIATIILRFPWLITSWSDEKFSAWIMNTADNLRDLALPIILMFAKSFTETGGSKPITPEAVDRASKIEVKP